jgi:hypothetical protein
VRRTSATTTAPSYHFTKTTRPRALYPVFYQVRERGSDRHGLGQIFPDCGQLIEDHATAPIFYEAWHDIGTHSAQGDPAKLHVGYFFMRLFGAQALARFSSQLLLLSRMTF